MGRSSFGRIEKLPSGKWRARYPDPRPGRLDRISAPGTFLTKSAARTWLNSQESMIADGSWESPEVIAEKARLAELEEERRGVTLRQYAARWVLERTNSKGEPIRIRTRVEYERLLRPVGTKGPKDKGGPLAGLIDLRMREISPDAVRSWRTERLETGKLTQTARAYDLLKSIMKTAVEDRIIDENPCKVKGGSSTSTGKEVIPPTDEQFEGIIDAMPDQYLAVVILYGGGGIRWGEATELRAKDVTVRKDENGEVVSVTLRITRQVVYTSETGRQQGKVKAAASERVVTLYGEDAVIIARQAQNKIGDALLITNPGGTSWLPYSTYYRHWNRARKAVGRPDMPQHALRHYAGTRYSQAGATVKETMARLGHSTERAAMRYQHAGNRDDELAQRVARKYGKVAG